MQRARTASRGTHLSSPGARTHNGLESRNTLPGGPALLPRACRLSASGLRPPLHGGQRHQVARAPEPRLQTGHAVAPLLLLSFLLLVPLIRGPVALLLPKSPTLALPLPRSS